MSRGQRASGFISRRGVHDPSCRVLLVGRIEVARAWVEALVPLEDTGLPVAGPSTCSLEIRWCFRVAVCLGGHHDRS
jgi:hypothetical protein